ncbi:tetratricopeptide repeat protein 28-like [Asterias rubens]|uniref:tetratricopeptide repeat protein 28-like n=1 Tax=Asterias rubens TaxID=7604 RepID=UPI0014553B78|nr:tetratricopeptide repeat protein 28-like [Asterias rubens]
MLAVEMGDVDKITTATIHHGDWILGSGHLKEAIAKVFQPLLKRNMSDKNRGLMLQSFGNACRASADFGTAKEYLREAIAIAERLEDPVAVADRHGDLGTTFRSGGRSTDALTHQKKQFVFAKQRGDQAALVVFCFNIGFTHYSMSPPDYDMALVYHAIHLELSDTIGYLAMKSRALNCLGKIYTALKDNEAAILLLVECLEVHSQTGNHRGLGIAYGNIGTVYRAMGPDRHATDRRHSCPLQHFQCGYHQPHRCLPDRDRSDSRGNGRGHLLQLAVTGGRNGLDVSRFHHQRKAKCHF